MNKRIILVAVVILLLAAAGIAAFTFRKSSEPGKAPAQSEKVDRTQHNFSDVDFAKQMIIHHQQAVEMADTILQKSDSSKVKQLAQKIKSDNEPQVTKLKAILTKWNEQYNDLSEFPEMSGHDMYPTLPGMATPEDLKSWKATSGTELNRAFLQMMFTHHNGGIEMAKREQQGGQFGELIDLAKTIESVQTAELAQIKSYQ